MKKLSLLLLAIIFLQCSKDDPTASSINMSATVDDQPWKVDLILTRVIRDGNQLFIEGHGQDGSWLEIYFANGAVGSATATGMLTGQIATCYVRYAPPGLLSSYTSFMPVASAGQATITELDTNNSTVSGTFMGSLTKFEPGSPIIEVTAGTFTDLPFEEGNLLIEIEDAPQDMAFAKVNGVLTPFTFSYIGAGGGTRLGFTDGTDDLEMGTDGDWALGSFPLGPSSTSHYMKLGADESTSGTLIITREGDGRIEGTFTFTTGSGNVTEGVFGYTF